MKNKMKKLFSCLLAVVVAVSCMAYVATNMTSALEFSFDSVTGTTEYNEDNTQATIKFDLSNMPDEYSIKQFIDENYMDLDHKEDTKEYSMVVTENKTYTFNIVYSDGSKDDKGNEIETTVKKEVVVDGIKDVKEETKENDPDKIPAKASTNAGIQVNTGSATTIDLSAVDGDVVITTNGIKVYDQVSKTDTVVETSLNDNGYIFTGTTDKYHIDVEPGVTTEITLDNITMSSNVIYQAYSSYPINKYASCIDVTGADTIINIVGNVELTYNPGVVQDTASSHNGCALEKSGMDGSLIVNGPGTLTATGGKFHDGCISSSMQQTLIGNGGFSNVTFKNVTVEAQAGVHCPGIGAMCVAYRYSAGKQYCKNIVFDDANITAFGGNGCAGIGSGCGVKVDGISFINGSIIEAHGGAYSPGIGTGGITFGNGGNAAGDSYADYGVSNLTISGGETMITAYGDQTTNMPGIGCGKGANKWKEESRILTNVAANPETSYQGYVKYGTSDTNYSFSTASPKTPFPTSEEFGSYLQGESDKGNPVYYTQVYFGPYKDNNSIDLNAEIGSNDTVMKTGGAELSTADLIKLTVPSGHEKDGTEIDFSSYTLDPDEVKLINDAKKAGKVGDFPLTYKYSYTDDEGVKTLTVVSTVSLREEGKSKNDKNPSIGANGAIHKTGGDALTDEEIVKLTDLCVNNSQGMNVIIKDTDGKLVIPDTVVIDATELNDAKVAGETGTYPVTYTYTPEGGTPLTLTVNVTLTDNGNETVEGPEIGSNNISKRCDGKEYSAKDIKKDAGVVARDSNGNIIDSSKLIPNADQLKVISDARKNKEAGEFDIEFTFEDVDGTIVTVTSKVTLYNEELPVITAQDTTITKDDAKKITDKKDLIDIMKAEVTLTDGTKVKPTGVVVTDFDKIKNGVPGTYKVTFTYMTEDGELVSVTKTLTISNVTVTNNTTKTDVKTGDNTNMTGYIVLGLLSSMFLLVLSYKRKKQLDK